MCMHSDVIACLEPYSSMAAAYGKRGRDRRTTAAEMFTVITVP